MMEYRNFEEDLNVKLRQFVDYNAEEACQVLTELQHSIQTLLTSLTADACDQSVQIIPDPAGVTANIPTPSRQESKVKPKINASLIQINAGKSEVERRMNAFIERKQEEVDDQNIREFCNVLHTHPQQQVRENSCARTDAVFVPRGDCKSHFKVRKVLNEYGPQTRLLHPSNEHQTPAEVNQKATLNQDQKLEQGLGERLHNLEGHVGIQKSEEKAIFARVRELEERVLYLESLSPEYFNAQPRKLKRGPNSPSKSRNAIQAMDIPEIEDKITALKRKLLAKKVKLEPA